MRFEASPRYTTVASSPPDTGVAGSPSGSVGTTVGGGAMVGGGTSVGTDVGDATLIVAGAETLSTPSGEVVAVRPAPDLQLRHTGPLPRHPRLLGGNG